MEQRTRHTLRRLIELTTRAVGGGMMSLPKAAETLESAGVPFEVVCRVLMPFKDSASRFASSAGEQRGGVRVPPGSRSRKL